MTGTGLTAETAIETGMNAETAIGMLITTGGSIETISPRIAVMHHPRL
jgi:hypothetical protein